MKHIETMKLALEALEKLNNTNSHWWQEVDENVIVQLSNAESALREALAEQPAPVQQEPVDFASLLREAEEIVRGKPTWKRFIDGTPLANDIAVWMTVFAQDVARRTSPQPAQRKPLTDEQIDAEFDAFASKFDHESNEWLDMGVDAYFRAGFKAAHGIKENT